MKTLRYLLLIPAALLAAACGDATALTEPAAREASPPETAAAAYLPAPSPTFVDILLAENARTGEFSTLIAAVVRAELVEALSAQGQATVFAPTDAAFAALGLDASTVGVLPKGELTRLLTYHLAEGRLEAATVVTLERISMANGQDAEVRLDNGEVFIQNARVIATDIAATNGVVHVINAVMLNPAPAGHLVDVLLAENARTGEFSTLIAAVVAAGLAEALSSQVSQGTVFAPTDAAFAALGLDAGNIGTVPVAQLRSILTYHLAPERRDAASVLASSRIRMVNGRFARIRVRNGNAYINDARILLTDVAATNGIAHVIDAVLLP